MGKSLKGQTYYTIAFISVFSILITSCAKVPVDPTSTVSGSSSQSVVSENHSSSTSSSFSSVIEEPTPTDVPPIEQSEAAMTITAEELGIDSISGSYFYWSPDVSHAIFVGAIKDDKGKWAENVYLFRANDKKIIKVLDGFNDKITFMIEPQWSADCNLVTVPYYLSDEKEYPIYLYDIVQGRLDKLPVTGNFPTISPDKSKVAYFKKDAGLSIFNLSTRTTTAIPGKIKGSNLLWFSDNTRILFKKAIIEDGSPKIESERILTDICLIDTTNTANIPSFKVRTVGGELTWLIQDQLAWNKAQGEGITFGTQDVDSKKYTDFGEFSGAIYQTDSKDAQLILIDQEKDYRPGFKLLGRNMAEQGKYLAEIMFSNGIALGLLADGNLLYLSQKQGQSVNTIMLSYLNQKKFVALSTVEGSFIIIKSKDGSQIALVSQDADKMVLIDTTKIKAP